MTSGIDNTNQLVGKQNLTDVVPSRNMVVIRMGNASDPANPVFSVSGFDNELWEKISDLMK